MSATGFPLAGTEMSATINRLKAIADQAANEPEHGKGCFTGVF
jgi:hypothetical protein